MSDTTTQTGGGPIAAPDGGTGQPRIVPAWPGWWWRQGNRGPYVEEVDGDQNHAPFLAMDGSDVVDDGTWLAPIPGPAVCAALAEYMAAFMARDMGEENEEEQWWWCLHCERVNHGERPDQCPHGDCDGDWLDMWPWDQIRDGEGFGDYPLTPDPSMVYPMYADTHGGTRTAYPATGGAA